MNKKELENLTSEQLQKLSLEKNTKGNATDIALTAQEILWGRAGETFKVKGNEIDYKPRTYTATKNQSEEEWLHASMERKKDGTPTKRAVIAMKMLKRQNETKKEAKQVKTVKHIKDPDYVIDVKVIRDYTNGLITKEEFDAYCEEEKQKQSKRR